SLVLHGTPARPARAGVLLSGSVPSIIHSASEALWLAALLAILCLASACGRPPGAGPGRGGSPPRVPPAGAVAEFRRGLAPHVRGPDRRRDLRLSGDRGEGPRQDPIAVGDQGADRDPAAGARAG